jgi:hypothetical protein
LKVTAEPFKGASVRRGFTGVLQLSRP